ncbi:MAG: hypothetical protein ACP5OG_04995 [Candidatus Nanoarchaeia archaeon]
MAKEKTIVKRKKFFEVEIPFSRSKVELSGDKIEDLDNRVIKLDLTRQLKGKSVEAVIQVKVKDGEASAYPKKITLMSYFIRRMIRKRISYVEDSFLAKTQESLVKIKPFLITRKRVSRAVRKTLRNLTKNWLEDYLAERTDEEIFAEIFSNRLQKPLSLKLKKTYPLSLCEIRVIEIVRPLEASEVPKIEKKKAEEVKEEEQVEVIDQLAEIEEELKKSKIKEAEEEIKVTQEKAIQKEGEEREETLVEAVENNKEKPKKGRKKKEENSE